MTTRPRIRWLAATAAALALTALPLSAAEVALPDAWRPIRQPGATAVSAVPDADSIPYDPQLLGRDRGLLGREPALDSTSNAHGSQSRGTQERRGARRQPHPAVVRVIAPERNGTSLGSGTLVAVGDDYGIVVTNWHVVRDATKPLVVVFPDGFRSPGSVLKTDRNWDLAAVAVQRPDVPPVALSAAAPQPGETLTIAGYGAGSYRAATGRCTQYLSPGRRLPFEMVEVSTAARQGDSGGPIFNRRGELAGVLFGATHETTSGSYCLRVAEFLAPLLDDADAEAGGATAMVAAASARIERLPPVPRPHPHASAMAAAAALTDYPATFAPQGLPDDGPWEREPLDDNLHGGGPQVAGWRPGRVAPEQSPAAADIAVDSPPAPADQAAAADADRLDDYNTYDAYAHYDRAETADEPTTDDDSTSTEPSDGTFADARDTYVPLPQGPIPSDAATAETACIIASPTPRIATETIVLDAAAGEPSSSAEPQDITWQDVAGTSLWDQAKTVLAVLGVIAIALHGLRWMKMV